MKCSFFSDLILLFSAALTRCEIGATLSDFVSTQVFTKYTVCVAGAVSICNRHEKPAPCSQQCPTFVSFLTPLCVEILTAGLLEPHVSI